MRNLCTHFQCIWDFCSAGIPHHDIQRSEIPAEFYFLPYVLCQSIINVMSNNDMSDLRCNPFCFVTGWLLGINLNSVDRIKARLVVSIYSFVIPLHVAGWRRARKGDAGKWYHRHVINEKQIFILFLLSPIIYR